jgi:hypothetical protein
MPVVFINSWLGNHRSNLKIKEVATCECTLTTSFEVVQSSCVAWVNITIRGHFLCIVYYLPIKLKTTNWTFVGGSIHHAMNNWLEISSWRSKKP